MSHLTAIHHDVPAHIGPPFAATPVARPRLTVVPDLPVSPTTAAVPPAALAVGADEDGSLVAEYGLLAVVAATVAAVLIAWASGGALTSFFGQLLTHARSLVVG